MRHVDLREFETAERVSLSFEERDALLGLDADLTITPVRGAEDAYNVRPSFRVGAMQVGDLAVRIRPKVDISRVMFLLSYAFDPKHWRDSGFAFDEDVDLLEAMLPGFLAKLHTAFGRGVLQGYRVEEEALSTVRGRIRFDDQIRYRQGLFPPIEVRFDEFTEDIEENRVLKAAIERLRHLRLRSPKMRTQLGRNAQLLENVAHVEYPRGRFPEFTWTRLNNRYRPAVQLSELILRSRSWDLRHGHTSATAFLVDMTDLFENFVVTALREKLHLDAARFPQGAKGRGLWLDQDRRVRLKPDISWWEAGECLFIGDAKYKRINVPGVKHADIYQLLAYCVATELPGGLLIYAKGEGDPATHVVRHLDKELHVIALDLEQSPDAILHQFDDIALRIRHLRARGLSAREAAA